MSEPFDLSISMKRTKAHWRDSRGSYHYGYWISGKFTGVRYQAPATRAEMARNPSFLLPGHDPEYVVNAEPYDGSPYVWFTPPIDEP